MTRLRRGRGIGPAVVLLGVFLVVSILYFRPAGPVGPDIIAEVIADDVRRERRLIPDIQGLMVTGDFDPQAVSARFPDTGVPVVFTTGRDRRDILGDLPRNVPARPAESRPDIRRFHGLFVSIGEGTQLDFCQFVVSPGRTIGYRPPFVINH